MQIAEEFPDTMIWRIGGEIESAKQFVSFGCREEFIHHYRRAWRLIREAQVPDLPAEPVEPTEDAQQGTLFELAET
jgi:hypothetical protein